MPENSYDRNGLTQRQLPEMLLSDGSPSSMTGPPPPMPHYLNAEGRAQMRFAVEGNAIITGGTGTLALESARALLEHGLAGLALFDIDPSHSAAAILALQRDFPSAKILATRVDVTDAEGVARATADAARDLGSIDILCCFAGVVGCAHAVDVAPGEWRRMLDINTTGSFLCAQAVAKHMIPARTGGSILLVASISAQAVNFPQPQAAYNVSKAGIRHLARCLAAEWAVHGIRVNSLSPGYMDTILNEGAGIASARSKWAERCPMGRMGASAELAGPVVLLCSRAGSYITGADLVVDGGATVF